MMNMYWENLEFQLPSLPGYGWYRSVDTALPSPEDVVALGQEVPMHGDVYTVTAHSVVILHSKPL